MCKCSGSEKVNEVKQLTSEFLIVVADMELDLNLEMGPNEIKIELKNPLMGAGQQPPVSYRQYKACQGIYRNTLIMANNYCSQIKNALRGSQVGEKLVSEIPKNLKKLHSSIREARDKYREAFKTALTASDDEKMIAEKAKDYVKEEKKKAAKMTVMKGKKGKGKKK